MAYQALTYDVSDGVGVITLNRPERLNALSGALLGELDEVLDAIERDDKTRAVVVCGSGAGFCSGFDLKEELEVAKPQTAAEWEPSIMAGYEVISRLWYLQRPTVAAVHGFALAAGFELALSCDLTVAGSEALFGEPEIRFGAGIVVLILPWLTHPKRAKELIFTGDDRLSAEQAKELGLVNRVVNTGEHLGKAVEMASHLSRMDPTAIQRAKTAINRTYDRMGMREGMRTAAEFDLIGEAIGNPVRREFARVVASEGLRAGLAWRERKFQT